MAAFDYGGGCPCGLYRQCDEGCEHHQANRLRSVAATDALKVMMRLTKADKFAALRRLEELMTKKEAA